MRESKILTSGLEDWIKVEPKFFQRTCMIALRILWIELFTLIIIWSDPKSSMNNLNQKLDTSLSLSFSKVSKNTLNTCLMTMTSKQEMNSFVISFQIFIQEFIYLVMKSLSTVTLYQSYSWFKMELSSFLLKESDLKTNSLSFQLTHILVITRFCTI